MHFSICWRLPSEASWENTCNLHHPSHHGPGTNYRAGCTIVTTVIVLLQQPGPLPIFHALNWQILMAVPHLVTVQPKMGFKMGIH